MKSLRVLVIRLIPIFGGKGTWSEESPYTLLVQQEEFKERTKATAPNGAQMRNSPRLITAL
jgi:hypothetical protein